MPKSKIGKLLTSVWPAGTRWLALARLGLAPRLASAILAAISWHLLLPIATSGVLACGIYILRLFKAI